MRIPRQLSFKGELESSSLSLWSSESGVSVLVEYILLIGILSLVLAFTVPQLNVLMSKLPTQNAMSNQFQDVASEISAQLTDMLLIAPKSGVVKSKVYMPSSVGKHTYSVEVSNGELVVKSNLWTQKVQLGETMLGFVTKGRTFSSEFTHEITLNSSTHMLPTAVAIVYPTEAAVNEKVTFDMTHSYGEGTLYYRWDFGDGNVTDWVEYDPTNPSTGIVIHRYSSPGNYTIRLEVRDSFGFTSSAVVHVNVTEVPEAELYVQKYVVPSTIAPGGTSEISIFLFGNGINQTSRNVTVIHTIDTSGSMNDYTPLSTYYESISPTPALLNYTVPARTSELFIFVTTPDFESFYLLYKIPPVSVYVKSPSQSYYTQVTSLYAYDGQIGYGYDVYDPQPGTWTVAINDLKPWSQETATVYFDRINYTSFFYYSENVTTKSVSVNPAYNSYDVSVPSEATKLGVELIPTQTSYDLYLWLKDDVNGYYLGPYSKWVNISYPSSLYTAFVVPDLPPNTAENYYLKTYIPKIAAAKIAAKTFDGILRKNPYNFIGVVRFGNDYASYVVYPPTNDTDLVNTSIDGLTATGDTPMALGLEYAINELDSFNNSENSPAVDVIVLLTDGIPNVDLAGHYNPPQAIRDTIYEAYQAKDRGYIIYTIGYGTDVNASLLEEIASITGGKYYFAANAQELENIYKSIARDILTKVAENVTISDVVPKEIDVVSADGARVTKTVNGTLVQWTVPVIRINQSWFGTITVTTTKTGVLTTDVLNVSNVTYYSVVKKKVVTVPLPARELNVSVKRYASFELK